MSPLVGPPNKAHCAVRNNDDVCYAWTNNPNPFSGPPAPTVKTVASEGFLGTGLSFFVDANDFLDDLGDSVLNRGTDIATGVVS
jgi:hypothetical protein